MLRKDTVAKVDVVTVEDVKISKFHWWSKWIDICVFNYGGCGYLLQMKVSRTNRKKFTISAMKRLFSVAEASANEAGPLTQMKG